MNELDIVQGFVTEPRTGIGVTRMGPGAPPLRMSTAYSLGTTAPRRRSSKRMPEGMSPCWRRRCSNPLIPAWTVEP